MRHAARLFASLVLIAPLAACGDDGGDDDDDDDDDDVVDVDGGDDVDAAAGEFTTLIRSEWTIPDGDEIYQCERLTVDRDMYIKSFRAVTPLGSHHSVLTVGEPTGPDGPSPCDAGTNQPAMIYGAGIDTNDITMPEGVAMLVPAGQQLLLNLHLYNVSDDPIEGASEVQVVEYDGVPEQEAEVVLMGRTIGMTIPEGESIQVGRCTMNGDVTLFMVNPHMHKLGTHMRVVAERGAGDLELHDGDYLFTEQTIYPIEPVTMQLGETVKVECTYDNDTGGSVSFGDSSDAEMCFATTYRYPRFGAQFNIVCDDGPQL